MRILKFNYQQLKRKSILKKKQKNLNQVSMLNSRSGYKIEIILYKRNYIRQWRSSLKKTK